MKKPDHVHKTERWHSVKAKDIPVKYHLSVGGRGYRVLSNEKNKIGGRVLKLERTYGRDGNLTLIVPKNVRFSVSRWKTKNRKK